MAGSVFSTYLYISAGNSLPSGDRIFKSKHFRISVATRVHSAFNVYSVVAQGNRHGVRLRQRLLRVAVPEHSVFGI